MKNPVKKRYLKRIVIANFYQYQIFEVDAGGNTWLEAVPVTAGVTRCAEDENVLKILLENDAYCMNNFGKRVR